MLAAAVEDIEDALPGLADAAESLAALAEELSGSRGEKDLLEEVRLLRSDLARVAGLAERGVDFCRRWSNMIQTSAGYLPTGEAVPIASSTISIRG